MQKLQDRNDWQVVHIHPMGHAHPHTEREREIKASKLDLDIFKGSKEKNCMIIHVALPSECNISESHQEAVEAQRSGDRRK